MTDTLVAPQTEAPAAAVQATAGEGYSLSPKLVTLSAPLEGPAEAIRAMRTHIMARHVSQGRRALAVCAASRSVGCSFIAANLAISMSQIGVKTLLIDGNLRRPSIEYLIRPPAHRQGLVQCLANPEANFLEHIDADILPDFSVMYAGGAETNAQELLAGDRFRALIAYCLREYDITIIDTPSANSCSDARRISTVVGYSLIVAGRDNTLVEDVKTLSRELEADHSRVVGSVLNQA